MNHLIAGKGICWWRALWLIAYLLIGASVQAQTFADGALRSLEREGGIPVLPVVTLGDVDSLSGNNTVIDMNAIPADDLDGIGFSSSSVGVASLPEPESDTIRKRKNTEISLPNCDDDDGDGVCNSQDYCDDTPNNAIVLPSGCHLTKGAPLELVGVFFDFNGTVLRPESFEILDRVVAVLRQQFQVVVEIGGHTDSRGSEEINIEVSDARAKAVYDYLIARGIASYRLRYRGYGSSQPVASNSLATGADNAEGRARNRRVDMRVISELTPETATK